MSEDIKINQEFDVVMIDEMGESKSMLMFKNYSDYLHYMNSQDGVLSELFVNVDKGDLN